MKKIFTRTKFPEAPGGNLYKWDEAKVGFVVSENGIYVIEVIASARNGKQNGTGDDDDLRMALDDYLFGKGENHRAQVSWHGFGVAAAWDGATLKGGEKTIYFFAELKKGKHSLTFRADGKPVLKKIEVFEIDKKDDALEDVVLQISETATGIKANHKGIPWKSFVFQSQFNTSSFRIRLIDIKATCKSAKQKNGKDGDNVKIYANGQIVTNPSAPTSRKYKNFFFSGDQIQGKTTTLMIPGDLFLFSESGDFSLELWYDEKPVLEEVKIEIEAGARYDRTKTFNRWVSHVAEWSRLPTSLKSKGYRIWEIMGQAWNLTIQYADMHGFFTIDDQGQHRRNTENNEADAFRHFVWSALLTHEFQAENAEIITNNHEIFWRDAQNKQDFDRGAIMDLWNNAKGREYAEKYPDDLPEELFKKAISKGHIIRKLDEVTDRRRNFILDTFSDLL